MFSNPFAINSVTVQSLLQMQCNTALKTKFTSKEVKVF